MKHYLRSFCLFLAFVCSTFIAHAQWVTIPDANFAAWLHNNGYDSCMNGNQLDAACADWISVPYTELDLSHQGISDLTGLEHIQWHDPMQPYLWPRINLSHNNFTSFPSQLLPILNHLTINLSYNHIDSFTFSNDHFSLMSLDLSHNHLKRIKKDTVNFNLNSLSYLFLDYNDLDSLPHLWANSGTGFYLYVRHNKLKKFPSGNMRYLDCGANLLDSNSIYTGFNIYSMDCDSNELTSLDLTGGGSLWQWGRLNCSHNKLTNLVLPSRKIQNIDCSNNRLANLPELADSMGTLDISDNTDLYCLPKLKKINYLDFSNTNVSCLPAYDGINSSNPPIQSMDLCEPGNTNGCPVYWNTTGIVFTENDGNCSFNNGDNSATNVMVKLLRNGTVVQQMASDYAGHFSVATDTTGIYDLVIDTTGLPFSVTCPPSGMYALNITPQDSVHVNRNFTLNCLPGHDLVAQSITAVFVPGRKRVVYAVGGDRSSFYGINCHAGLGGTVQLVIDGPASYYEPAFGAFTPTNVVNDTITWTVSDFTTVDFLNSFNIIAATDTTAQIGEQVCCTLLINPIAGDNSPADNVRTVCFTVVSSYDPNTKEVNPAGNITDTVQWLTYTIHFQNTGTAPAQDIHITDTLSSNADETTFKLLGYSHQPEIRLTGRAIRFNFANIFLPDSNANEEASHGYVQYKVRLKPNLPVGTVITNTAHIYFDFNAAVVTNTTSNTIVTDTLTSLAEDAVLAMAVRIIPNPASGVVVISTSDNLLNSDLHIYDITGRIVYSGRQATTNTAINTDSWATGVYLLNLQNGQQVITKRMVINH